MADSLTEAVFSRIESLGYRVFQESAPPDTAFPFVVINPPALQVSVERFTNDEVVDAATIVVNVYAKAADGLSGDQKALAVGKAIRNSLLTNWKTLSWTGGACLDAAKVGQEMAEDETRDDDGRIVYADRTSIEFLITDTLAA